MIDRFLSKISVESIGCFEYLGAKDKDGYGYFKLNGKTHKAHRLAIQLHTGVDPKGHLVLHHCDNPSCVNPDHLYLGTPKQNMQDRKDRNRNSGWSGYKAEGQLNNNSKLTEENVISIRANYTRGRAQELASMYNVCKQTVLRIVNKKYWKHV